MDDRFAALERKVSELSDTVAALERRFAAVEARGSGAAAPEENAAAPDPLGAVAAVEAASEIGVVAILTLIGRTCLVLGGAYLLRALTDAGTLPRAGGTALGLAYAAFWLALAYRLDGPRARLVAPFHAFATSMIAFPIIWEAQARSHLLSPGQAALAMAGVTALALVVAWIRRVQSVAWIVSAAGVTTTLAFFLAVPWPPTAFGFYLAFLGVATLWMGYSLDWIWLRWPVAFVADASVMAMAGAVTGHWQREGAPHVMALQLTMFAGYLVSFAARTLWRARDVVPFEVVQTLALLVVGFGGAVFVMQSTGAGAGGLGVASLVFAVGSYGVAFAFVNWRAGHWKNFSFYNSLAVVFMIAGVALAAWDGTQAMFWAGLAVAAAALGHRYSAATLGSHAAVYVVAGATVSGLFSVIGAAFTASVAHAWPAMGFAAWLVLLGAAACTVIPITPQGGGWNRYSRIPQVVVVLTLLCGVGAAVIDGVLPLLSAAPGPSADAAVAATVRTAVLGAAVLLLAWVGGRGIFAEGRWLTYVVLVLGGIKLLVEDFPSGRPATLVLSLAVYGAALILAPRWVKRAPRPSEIPVASAV
jgi:hypothetical protein